MRQRLLLLFLLLFFGQKLMAQCPSPCATGVPSFTANLTGKPDSIWTSVASSRSKGTATGSCTQGCCGNGDNCHQINITLDVNAVGIKFDIIGSGLGNVTYQINCGDPIDFDRDAVICLTGVGPHKLTFCKPGDNEFGYKVSSVAKPTSGTDVIVSNECIGRPIASGFVTSSTTWNSISPGASGAFNSYLSCTSGCLSPLVAAPGGATPPPNISFQICGKPAAVCSVPSVCDTVTVTFRPELFAAITPVDPSICFPATTRLLTVTATGGTPPYKYSWNTVPVQTTRIATVTSGNFTVTVSDGTICAPATASVTVTTFLSSITANAGANVSVCESLPNAVLSGSVTGTTTGIWSGGGGSFSPSITTLANVTYTPTAGEVTAGFVDLTLTTTNNGTCPPASDVMRVIFNRIPGASAAITPIACKGLLTGAANAQASGSAPFTYSWSTGSTNQAITGLGVGSYTLTVRDNNGCRNTSVAVITEPATFLIGSISTVISAGCDGGFLGTTVNGGVPGYTYSWVKSTATNQIASSPSISGLYAGNYTVTITDAAGCQAIANRDVLADPPFITTPTITHVNCFGESNGSISLLTTGGKTPYSYVWNGGAASTVTSVSGLAAGNNTIVISDNGGCDTTIFITITQPTDLVVDIINARDIQCTAKPGEATATAAGGTSAYSFLWSNGATTASITGLTVANTYVVTLTDSHGCKKVDSQIINLIPVITFTPVVVNVNCFGESTGSIALTGVSGGAGTLTYTWSPVAGSGTSITGLGAANYFVRIDDANSCTTTYTATVTQPLAPLSISTFSSVNVACFGGNTGSASLTVAGGTSTYTYAWTGGVSTTSTATGLIAGTYVATITDSKGCKITQSFTITEPTDLVVDIINARDIQCTAKPGEATATAAGGTSAYSFLWSNGATTASITGLTVANTYVVTLTDSHGCKKVDSQIINLIPVITFTPVVVNVNCFGESTGSIALTGVSGGAGTLTYTWSPVAGSGTSITGLGAANYFVRIDDANSCTTTYTATVTQPLAPLSISTFSSVNVACFGGNTGSASLTVAGGTSTYTYAWTGGVSTTSTATGLIAGTYVATITDSKGCKITQSFTITEPTDLVVDIINARDIQCTAKPGEATATAAGGTSAYSFLWSNGATTASITGLTVAGSYVVTLTDSHGCKEEATQIINLIPVITFTPNIIDVLCFGENTGSIDLVGVGGGSTVSSPLSYTWSPVVGSGTSIAGLGAATYFVRIVDENSCVTTYSAAVTQPVAPLSISTFSSVNVACFGEPTGSASVTVAGGTSTYTYVWSGSTSTESTATGLIAGTYVATITDSNGCKITQSFTITEPTDLVLDIVNARDIQCTAKPGEATATAAGGTSAYSFLWSNGATTASITGLTVAGSYVVTLTDSHGCKEEATQIINLIPVITFTPNIIDVLCFGENTGSIDLVGVGGGSTVSSPLSYTWSPVVGSGTSIAGLGAATYFVRIVDENSCVTTYSAAVTQPVAPLSISTFSSVNVACFGEPTGSASVTVAGGTSTYTYVWSGSASTESTATGLIVGTYVATITDSNGCSITQSFDVTEPTSITASIVNAVNINCADVADGRMSVSANGGTGALSYLWSPLGQTTATITGLSAGPSFPAGGVYSLTVSDENACFVDLTQTLTVNPLLITTLSAPPATICFGAETGAIDITTSGGIGAIHDYLWLPTGETTEDIADLPVGTYTAIITDDLGCDDTLSVVISQFPNITITTTILTTNTSCVVPYNGIATVTASDILTNTFTYLWDADAGSQSNAAATGLRGGAYTVVATNDATGCTEQASILMTDSDGPVVDIIGSDNLRCFNDGTGSAFATAIPSGFEPIATYEWINVTDPTSYVVVATGVTTVTSLTAGKYIFKVTDDGFCVDADSITITQPSNLTAFTSQGIIKCFGESTDASVLAFGGITPYSYAWDNPGASTDLSVTGLLVGTYNVSVTDLNTCTVIKKIVLDEPTDVLFTTNTFRDVSCFGYADGEAVANVATGGVGSYTYEWVPYGGTTPIAAGLSGGTFTAYVYDFNFCADSLTFVIDEPPLFESTVTSVTSISCNEGSNGEIELTTIGGFGAYHYLWAPNGETTSTITGLETGNYSVEVKDDNNCTVTASQFILEPAAPLGLLSTTENVLCNLDDNGSISVAVSGGTPIYTYTWTPDVGATENVTGLTAGTYTLTVTDNNLCTFTSSIFEVSEPATLTTTITGSSVVSCFGYSDGFANSLTVGGTANYSYLWEPSGANTESISGVPSGVYTITVTDGNNCISSNVVDLSGPAVGMTTSYTFTDVLCHGQNTGEIDVSVAGGNGGFTYLWSPGNQTTSSITGLTFGNYSVLITDSKNCSETISHQIQQPAAPLGLLSTTENVLCNLDDNGSISVAVSGGTPIYTYTWTPDVGATENVTGLTAGTYTLTVTDNNLCTFTSSIFEVSEPATLTTTITGSSVVSCFGYSDGFANSLTAGGTANYSYLWEPSGANTESISGVTSGVYTITVTDGNNCISTNVVDLSGPTVGMTTSYTFTDVLCNGQNTGEIDVTVAGGNGGFTYLWSPGNQTTSTITGLPSGNYSVIIADSKNCTETISQQIQQPAAPLGILSTTENVLCNLDDNGSISVAVSGGTPIYTYTWTPDVGATENVTGLTAGTYTLTVTDNNLCTFTSSIFEVSEPATFTTTITSFSVVSCFGLSDAFATSSSNGGTLNYTFDWQPAAGNTANITGMPTGIYTLTVTDNNNCTTVNVVDLTEPPLLTLASTPTDILCNGGATGSITTVVGGGNGSYTYLWTPGNQTTASISNLTSGNYSVIVRDSKNCSETTSESLTQPSAPLGMLSSVSNVICNSESNGVVSVSVSGGTPNYSYSWTPNVGTNANITGLPAGNYSVLVTDASLCTFTSGTFNVTEPVTLTATIPSFTTISCFGESDGTAQAVAAGGVLSYTYLWMPGGANSSSISGVPTGIYTFTVTDANNCVALNSVNITQPDILTLTLTTFTNVSCFGGNNGTAQVSAVGGTPLYTYTWTPAPSPGVTTNPSVGTLISENFLVVVNDDNNCLASVNVTIDEPTQLTVSASVIKQTKCNLPNGEATCQASGGTPPYTYLWTNSLATETVTGLAPGTYSVTITDANGCPVTSSSITIDPSDAIVASMTNTIVSCFAGEDGTATISLANVVEPIVYTWTPNVSVEATASFLTAGNYSVDIEDAQGCLATTSTVVSQPAFALELAAPLPQVNVNCFGMSNGQITALATGGTPGYNYYWTPIDVSNQIATGLAAGEYSVKVTDSKGCTDSDSYTITEPDQIVVSIDPQPDYVCPNSLVTLSASATGGLGNFIFSWVANPAGTPLPSTNPLFVNPAITTTYTLSAVDQVACNTGLTQEVVINVSNPTISAYTNKTICELDSVLLGAKITGSFATATWNYDWSNGSNSQTDFYVKPSESITYTLTATNDCGQILTDVVEVEVIKLPITKIIPLQHTLCGPDSIVFSSDFTPPEGTAYEYFWNFENKFSSTALEPKYTFDESGDYPIILRVIDRGCMTIDITSVAISASEPPIADFTYSPDDVGELNPTVYFTNTSIDANYYKWYFTEEERDSSMIENPIYHYPDSGSYNVKLIAYKTVGNSFCVDTTIQVIKVNAELTIYIPNAFTPNPDNFNPIFQVKGTNLAEVYMEIYDRWGLMMYKTPDPFDLTLGWDGTYKGAPAKQDVYVYRVVARDIKGKKYTMHGDVTLMR
ncbi:MAG: T9SS type B sorting domain-containing protein [Bacteroidota bacterium]